MKKFLSLAIAVIATMGLTMSAASLRNQDSKETKQKKERTEKRESKDRKGHGPQRQGFNPFAGLNLTEQQQNQLKALRPQKPAECCENDTAACCKGKGEACCKVTPEQAKQMAQERLAKIKGILTPEQYQQYLENVAVNQMLQRQQGDRRMKDASNKKGREKARDSKKKGQSGEKISQSEPRTKK